MPNTESLKTCSCCGDTAGRYKQWHNRDTGYGICARCVAWIKSRGMTAAEFRFCYGEAGIHYEDNPNA